MAPVEYTREEYARKLAEWMANTPLDEANSAGKQPGYFTLDYGAKEPTLGGDIMATATGALEGIGTSLSLPLDLASAGGNFALKKMGYSPDLPYIGDAVREGVSKLSGGYEPQNLTEKAKQIASNFGAGLLVPMGAGRKLVQATEAGSALNKVGKVLSDAPGLQVAGAMGGAGGSIAAETIDPEHRSAVLQTGLPILASLIPGAGSGVVTALQNTTDDAVKVAAKKVAQDTALQTMGSSREDAAAAAAKVASQLQTEANPYTQYRPTAEVMEDPSVSALHRATPEALPELDKQALERNKAIVGDMEKVANKQPTGSVEAVREELKVIADDMQSEIDGYAKAAFSGASEIPTTRIKGAVTSVVNKFTKTKEGTRGATELPASLSNLIEAFNELPKNASLETIHNFASKFGAFARVSDLETDTVVRQAAAVAAAARAQIENAIEGAMKSQKLSERAARAYNKMKETRLEMGRLFERGTPGKIIERAPMSEDFRMPSEKVVPTSLSSSISSQQMEEALARGGAKSKALGDQMYIDSVYAASVDNATGAFNSNKFMKAMEELPEESQQVFRAIMDDSVSKKSFAQSRNISVPRSDTAVNQSAIGAMAGALKKNALQGLGSKYPSLKWIVDPMEAAFNTTQRTSDEAKKILIDAVVNFGDYQALLKPLDSPEGMGAFEALAKTIVGSLTGGARGGTEVFAANSQRTQDAGNLPSIYNQLEGVSSAQAQEFTPLSRDVDAVNSEYIEQLATKIGLIDPMTGVPNPNLSEGQLAAKQSLNKIVYEYTNLQRDPEGARRRMKEVLESMADDPEFQPLFEDGIGFNGEVSNPAMQKRILDQMRTASMEGKVTHTQRAKQMQSFNSGVNTLVSPESYQPKKTTSDKKNVAPTKYKAREYSY